MSASELIPLAISGAVSRAKDSPQREGK